MNRNNYIVVIIILIILFILTPFTLNKNKTLFIEKIIIDTNNLVQKVFDYPKSYLTKTKIKYVENDKTKYYETLLNEKEKEINTLKDTLNLNNTLSEYESINSTILSRDIDSWYNLITIDKGKTSGVKEGYAVINSKGLIGKVSNVGNYYSTVKLLTTEEIKNKISIKIILDNTELYGLLIGYDKSNNVYKIEGVNNLEDIKEDSIVTTTGLTDYFPSGILIGKVYRVVKDEYDLNSIVEVKPAVNFDDIGIVTVLKKGD